MTFWVAYSGALGELGLLWAFSGRRLIKIDPWAGKEGEEERRSGREREICHQRRRLRAAGEGGNHRPG